MSERVLLCTDLDRTLLPNGDPPESPRARELFARVVSRREVTLAYVSGRNLPLVEEAIEEYQLPGPDFVIGDVGTTVYRRAAEGFEPVPAWTARLDRSWIALSAASVLRRLGDLPELRPQETEQQGRHKISFFTDPEVDREKVVATVYARLGRLATDVRYVWSVDEAAGRGLLDVIPAVAGKRAAIAFLMEERGFTLGQTLFAGDSGNDLEVLASPIPSVLVANARPGIRDGAVRLSEAAGTRHLLHLAEGGWHGLNGNYAAGILEGIAHYHPALVADLDPDA